MWREKRIPKSHSFALARICTCTLVTRTFKVKGMSDYIGKHLLGRTPGAVPFEDMTLRKPDMHSRLADSSCCFEALEDAPLSASFVHLLTDLAFRNAARFKVQAAQRMIAVLNNR